MRFFLLFLMLLALPGWADGPAEEEILAARRIRSLWQAKKIAFVEREIQSYLDTYPEGRFTSHVYAILGDIALQNEALERALDAYEKIWNQKVVGATRLKKWHCLYHLQHYQTLLDEIASLETTEFEAFEGKEAELVHFYYAEALFRKAVPLFQKAVRLREAKKFLKKALAHYKAQNLEPFYYQTMGAVAEIYRLIGRPQEAASHYLALAQELEKTDPLLQEKMLFYAGRMLAMFDVDRACKTFALLIDKETTVQAEAAYEWLSVLAKHKEDIALLKAQDVIKTRIKARQLPLFHHHIGWAYFNHKRYKEALLHFELYLECESGEGDLSTTTLAYLFGAKELKNRLLLETGLSYLRQKTIDDPEKRLVGALIVAEAYVKLKQPQLAKQCLTHTLETFFSEENDACLEKREQVSHLLAHLLLQEESYEKGRFICEQSLSKSSKKGEKALLKLLSYISLNEFAACHDAQEKYAVCHRLVADLEKALDAHVYDPQETFDKKITLARAALTLKEYDKAAQLLLACTADPHYSSSGKNQQAELHFLLSVAALEKGEFALSFDEGEKALAIAPNFKESRVCHLNAFNAALHFDKQKAADHLLIALRDFPKEQATEPIALSNLLWLSHTLYKQAREDRKELEKARFALEYLLGQCRDTPQLPISEQTLFLEKEALKLGTVYQRLGESQLEQELLENLFSLQQAHPHWPWKAFFQTKLELALSYLKMSKKRIAQELLLSIEDAHRTCDPLIRDRATLALARSLADPTRFEKLIEQRQFPTEPIHLEAALDLIALKTAALPEETQLSFEKESLKQMKKLFTQKSDIVSKDYHAWRKQMPEKQPLFDAYISFIDARLALIKGNEKKAHAFLNQVNETGLTPYLEARLKQ